MTGNSSYGRQATARLPLLLIVEPDSAALTAIGDVFRERGYRVVETGDAEEALAQADREMPEVAILAHHLPRLSGIRLAARLNASSNVPVILLSASAEDVVDEALGAGAFICVAKPVDPRQLSQLVRSAWHWRRADPRSTEDQLRMINVVTGLLMERLSITQSESHSRLRRYARSRRLKVSDVARAVLEASERSNELDAAMAAMAVGDSAP